MRIHLSGLIQDMHGSLGNLVASSWKGLHYWREKASLVTNPRTEAQALMRNGLGVALAAYAGLPDVQKALWEEYAQGQGRANEDESQEGSRGIIPPRSKTQSGINAYVGVNQCLKSAALTMVAVPPFPVSIIGAESISYSISGAPPNESYDVAIVVDGVVPAGTWCRLWVQGKWAGSHGYITGYGEGDGSDTVTISFTTMRVGSNGHIDEVPFINLPGRRIAMQADFVDDTGARSPGSEIIFATL